MTIGALSFPLVSDPGYEYAAASAVGASLVAGLLSLYRPGTGGRAATRSPQARDVSLGSVAQLHGTQLALSLIPLLCALPWWWITTGCGPHDALVWYPLLVLPSALISTSLALFVESLLRRRWLRGVVFLLLWSASLVRGGYEALTGPHIFLYAWQIGFFPGGSWETELSIPSILPPYRVLSIVVGLGLCGIAILVHRIRTEDDTHITPARCAVAFAVVVAVFALWMIEREELGFTRSYEYVERTLDDSVTGRYTTIRYNASSIDSLDLWIAIATADSSLIDHARLLGVSAEALSGTRIYLYGTEEEEREMVGVGFLAFTKPWQQCVHMQSRDVGRALRHELAHVALAPYGVLLGLTPAQGMLEGSAVSMEGSTSWRTPAEHARAAYAAGLAPSPERIMGAGGFTSLRPQLAYRLAGAFSQWLIATYGMKRYLQAFGDGDLVDAYGVPAGHLSDKFRASLDSLPEPDSMELAATRYLFGGGGFFRQRCLRRIGGLNTRAERAMASGDYRRAVTIYQEALEEGAHPTSRDGMLRALWSMGEWRSFLDSMSVYTRDSNRLFYLALEIERGDALWSIGDTSGARRCYERVFRMDITRSLSLRAALRLVFLSTDDTLRWAMRSYFTRRMGIEGRLALLNGAMRKTELWGEKLLLTLMHGSLTVRRTPVTTITAMAGLEQEDLPDNWTRWGNDLPFCFAVRELCRDLYPAYAYAASVAPTAYAFNPAFVVDRLVIRRLPMPKSVLVATWP